MSVYSSYIYVYITTVCVHITVVVMQSVMLASVCVFLLLLLTGQGSASEFFEVAFVRTTYTVSESVSSVDVCVNLTRPTVDILDEFVVVEVTDFPSSVYIPADVTLASKLV